MCMCARMSMVGLCVCACVRACQYWGWSILGGWSTLCVCLCARVRVLQVFHTAHEALAKARRQYLYYRPGSPVGLPAVVYFYPARGRLASWASLFLLFVSRSWAAGLSGIFFLFVAASSASNFCRQRPSSRRYLLESCKYSAPPMRSTSHQSGKPLLVLSRVALHRATPPAGVGIRGFRTSCPNNTEVLIGQTGA